MAGMLIEVRYERPREKIQESLKMKEKGNFGNGETGNIASGQ